MSSHNHSGVYAPVGGTGTSGTWPISITGNAATASAVAWSGITSKPTTLAGYGITDAAADSQTMYIGTTAVAINRASAALTLAGVSVGGSSASCTGNSATATNSTQLSGQTLSAVAGNNTVVQRTSAGYIVANYFNTTANVVSASISHIAVQTSSDSYIRWATPTTILSTIGAAASSHTHSYAPLTGTGTSGTWPISVTGSSASCTGNSASVTINYWNDSNSIYYMLWGSGNGVYATGGICCNPATNTLLINRDVSDGTGAILQVGGDATMANLRLSNDLRVGTTGTVDGLGGTAGAVGAGMSSAGYFSVARNNVSGYFNRLTSDGQCVNFRRQGVTVGSISVSATATAYTTSSDIRLKQNIQDATSAIESISNIKIRSFDWKANNEHQEYGVIAQEVYEVVPESVDIGEMWSVDNSKFVPRLIKAVQEQQIRINELETKLLNYIN